MICNDIYFRRKIICIYVQKLEVNGKPSRINIHATLFAYFYDAN